MKHSIPRDATIPERVYELLQMLTYKRPAGSTTEAAFIDRYIVPLGAERDEAGNYWLTVGASPILWSCHTDTVHKHPGRQKVLYGDHIASVKGSSCLGADCTVGVWIMVHMVRAGIPGTYVFHAEEEVGGLGSAYVAMETPERVAGLQYAIAFDRKGTDEVIYSQLGGDCASQAFATSLCEVLAPLHYVPSDGGTFTDTANYAEVIPECCNLSVGYYKQHTSNEHLDVGHAERLLDRILVAPFDRLVCQRIPAPIICSYSPGYAGGAWSGNGKAADASVPTAMLPYVKKFPNDAADFLEAQGFTAADIESWVWGRYDRKVA